MLYLPPIEKEDMDNSGSHAGKISTIYHSKHGAEIERALTLIRIHVNVEVWIYNSRDIVALAGHSEQAI